VRFHGNPPGAHQIASSAFGEACAAVGAAKTVCQTLASISQSITKEIRPRMHYRKLGRSEINVSEICLGTMTFGEQNSEADAHQQLDYALDRGVNFIDAAEMYPVPPSAETQGRTEQYIGSWLARTGRRSDVILATKVTGHARTNMDYIRRGETPRLSPAHIRQAIEASLDRLQTDYVDLYQLHWPDRYTNTFGQRGFTFDASETPVPIEETLGELGRLIAEGKIRHVGLSNETPWGVMRFLRAAETENLPRAVSIQNPYSLLNRSYEIGLSECSIREDIGLLAYSPLAFGVLSGKYLGGARPEGARLTKWSRFARYSSARGAEAAAAYAALARQHGLDPAQMALAYVTSRDFVTSNIIGATTMEQLRSNIDSADLTLPAELIEAIEAIHADNPNPCP
jgi:aryl-alcohol dehydrogenase-like predicted oxidoreductase